MWPSRLLAGRPAPEKIRALRRLWVHFGPLVRSERRPLALAIVAGTFSAMMTLARPWPLKVVFDHVLGHHPYRGWLEPLARLDPGTVIGLLSAVFLGLVFIEGLLAYRQQIWTAAAGQRVVFALRKKLFNHLLGLSLAFHRRRRTGDLLVHLTGDIQLLRDTVIDGAVVVTGQVALVVAMVAVAAWMDPVLTLTALLVVPVLALSSLRVSKGIREATRSQRKREGQLAAGAAETLQAIAVVQAFGCERRHAETFAAQSKSSLKQGLRTTRLEAMMGRVAELTTAVGICAVVYLGTRRAAAGILTPGGLIVFVSYLAIIYKPIRRMARFSGRSSKALVCAERIADLLESDVRVRERPDAVPAPRFEGRIDLEEVSYTYPQAARPALEAVTLAVKPGEVVALAGPIGSGKTTLVSLLLRLSDPDSGVVRIDGRDARELTLESLRGRIAFVPQEPILFHASVHDNIAYGRADATRKQVEAAARAVGADDYVDKLPQGYETVLGEKGATLSTGQRQLLAIARALVKDAPIVVLDEPTSGLDAVSREAVRRALRVLLAGRTAILITHTLAEAAAADRIVVLRRGRIIETGEPAALAASGGWFQRAIAAQEIPVGEGSS